MPFASAYSSYRSDLIVPALIYALITKRKLDYSKFKLLAHSSKQANKRSDAHRFFSGVVDLLFRPCRGRFQGRCKEEARAAGPLAPLAEPVHALPTWMPHQLPWHRCVLHSMVPRVPMYTPGLHQGPGSASSQSIDGATITRGIVPSCFVRPVK